jgi:hypothetical protein
MKTFQRSESGLEVKIFWTMTNRDMKKAIENEAELQKFPLNESAREYLNGLDNNDIFVETDEEFTVYFNYL